MENPTYTHKKRGSTYELLGIAELQHTANPERPLREGDGLAVYRSVTVNQKLWCRSVFEFFDGRFIPGQSKAVYHRDPGEMQIYSKTGSVDVQNSALHIIDDLAINGNKYLQKGFSSRGIQEARILLSGIYAVEQVK